MLRREFAERLTADGVVADPAWLRAFAEVPRHVFAPRFRHRGGDTATVWLDGADPAQRDEWLRVAYTDTSLITQVDAGSTATSASSQPSVMARMLAALEVCDGSRVLEVGTGTGYNAALLCHRLGAAQVVTVEVDERLADSARAALAMAGFQPTVVTGDGLAGYPPGAPYDRIIATCAVTAIPPAWVAQLADGGVMVASLGFGVVALRKRDGGLTGRFLPVHAAFMPAHAAQQAAAWTYQDALRLADGGGGVPRPVLVPPDVDDLDLRAFGRLFVPDLVRVGRTHDDGRVEWIVADPHTGSWALASGDRVTESGPRRLWAEVEAVYARWRAAGRPDPGRLSLHVDADGVHTVQVDDGPKQWRLHPPANVAGTH